jgi:hypothetical protein
MQRCKECTTKLAKLQSTLDPRHVYCSKVCQVNESLRTQGPMSFCLVMGNGDGGGSTPKKQRLTSVFDGKSDQVTGVSFDDMDSDNRVVLRNQRDSKGVVIEHPYELDALWTWTQLKGKNTDYFNTPLRPEDVQVIRDAGLARIAALPNHLVKDMQAGDEERFQEHMRILTEVYGQWGIMPRPLRQLAAQSPAAFLRLTPPTFFSRLSAADMATMGPEFQAYMAEMNIRSQTRTFAIQISPAEDDTDVAKIAGLHKLPFIWNSNSGKEVAAAFTAEFNRIIKETDASQFVLEWADGEYRIVVNNRVLLGSQRETDGFSLPSDMFSLLDPDELPSSANVVLRVTYHYIPPNVWVNILEPTPSGETHRSTRVDPHYLIPDFYMNAYRDHLNEQFQAQMPIVGAGAVYIEMTVSSIPADTTRESWIQAHDEFTEHPVMSALDRIHELFEDHLFGFDSITIKMRPRD